MTWYAFSNYYKTLMDRFYFELNYKAMTEFCVTKIATETLGEFVGLHDSISAIADMEDFVEVIMNVEDAFNREIPDDAMNGMDTVADIVDWLGANFSEEDFQGFKERNRF